MSEQLLEIHELSKVFPPATHALTDVTASFPRQQIIGLVGPDGAGKTTLIRLIAALLTPTAGFVRVAGYDTVKDPEPIHYLTGYMPQKFGLYEDLTVDQNLSLYAELRGVVGKEREETFARLLHFTGLAPFTDRLAGALSGGMKQKLGLACALIRKPLLLLLDEPSVGVDPISRRELWKMVHDLLKDGISVVWSTAYLDEAERCHSVLLLNEGKLLFNGDPKELAKRVDSRVFLLKGIKSNKRDVLARVLDQPNVIDAVIQGQDIRLVTKEVCKTPIDLTKFGLGRDAHLQPVTPRFEDGFIDILGGGPGNVSALADCTPPAKGEIELPIVAQGLTKKFGTFTAADDITFTVKRGEIFGLLGPNGAGKSTTFKMLCGLLQPTRGEAFVNGLDLQEAPGEARAHIGYMAQKFSLYGTLSVRLNMDFFSGIYNLVGKERVERVRQFIEIFGMQRYTADAANLLPLGFKQRLSLACATMHYPAILFLDEPTSGVDPITRREFWNHINGLVRKNVTVLVTTHFMDEAEYCDRIALIYRGRVIKMATPDILKEDVRSPENPEPTLEDAFIALIEAYDSEHGIG